ncbi:MAG: hypothetical protein L0Y54_17580 [Sporichthyaceae bacterium]|nr:hypothetical protein [Sporichthyaceae bacterium]
MSRQRNERLLDLVAQTGSSYEALMAHLRELARSRGQELGYGQSALAQWVAGHVPPPNVQRLFAQVLSAKLGRRVHPADVWLDALVERLLEFSGDVDEAVRLVTELWRHDVRRREFLRGTVDTALMVTPVFGWLITPVPETVSHAGIRRVGAADVRRLYTALERFGHADHHHGGGQLRESLVRYLHTRVTPLLNGRYSDRVGRELFRVAALLTRKAAMGAYDSGRHGLAQAYFTQALRLAHAASDPTLGAHVLASMSHHTLDLNRPADAVQIARAAAVGARRAAPAAILAKIAVLEARGHARLGDWVGCDRQLVAAAKLRERLTTETLDTAWPASVSAAYLDGQTAACYLDLDRADLAIRYASAALASYPAHQVRRRAMSSANLALAHARNRDLDAAANIGFDAVRLADQLDSARTRASLRALRLTLTPFASTGTVRDFLERTTPAAEPLDSVPTNAARLLGH